MRPILSVTVVVATLVAATSASHAQSAYSYPWCALYPGYIGATSCYYTTYQQCMATLSGIGGTCIPSPYYRGPEPARRRDKTRDPGQYPR